jgi:hypothetical protein
MTAQMPVTGSAGIDLSPYMAQLQQDFGSFDPNSIQTRRRQYYSYVAYPAAGQAVLSFFSTTIGGSSRQLTNIQRSGHLDNPFIVRAIACRYYIADEKNNSWAGTDATSGLYADIVNGLFQVGLLRIVIGAKEWMQLPSPFLYAPPAKGLGEVWTAGQAATNVSHGPYAELPNGADSAYVVDPAFMIGSDQNFQMTIEYPSGNVAAIGTTAVANDTSLYIGLELDGIEIRPLQ